MERSPQNFTTRCRDNEFEMSLENAKIFASHGQWDLAHQSYEAAANLDPDSEQPYIGMGAADLQQGKFDDANLAFRVALRLNRSSSQAYAGLAMLAQKKGSFNEAFDLYLKCLEHDSDNMAAILGLFETATSMGSFEKVIRYLELYLDSYPGDTAVMSALASLYIKHDNFKSAQQLLTKVLVLEPANQDAAWLLEEVDHNIAAAELFCEK